MPLKKQIKSFSELIPDSARYIVHSSSINIVNAFKNTYQYTGVDWDNRKKDVLNNKIEWHRKFSLSLACLVLFFIGAPLGSIIRKGGLGMPLVVAIIFFLLFHLLNMFGEKFVKDEILSPLMGMWLSILVLAPLGALLTYKAIHDSQLFNKEFYYRFFKSLRALITSAINKITLGKKNTLNL
jgi:lipopolysaccharide export system permease protein